MDHANTHGPDVDVQQAGAIASPQTSQDGGAGPLVQAGAPPVAPPAPTAATSWVPPSVPLQVDGGDSTKATSAAQVDAPSVADDGDIIEKEWVLKAKQIVMRTRQDPYLQTKELHKFKAKYMKKRYNKIIETVDE
jgi:hypothetical protein